MKKKWWMGKVAYQIWPKSFADSNGDGIGDLEGIIGKLDYLKDLGIDIIWISPLYKSPLVDQGYDISDYYDINPLFGDLETMDRLLAEAKKRDMYIVMDLVVNHCSDEHEWFKKACADPDGEYGKYFYIAEKKDGKLPCNWRSYFGGSVWEPIPGTDKYYFHAFHKKQPDLNWENPKVRQEVYKMMNWWFERGIAGFRIDAIINIKKKRLSHEANADRIAGAALLDMAGANLTVELPAELLAQNAEYQMNQLRQRLRKSQMTMELYCKSAGLTPEQVRENYRKEAERQLRAMLAVRAIAEAEKITVTQQEVDAEIAHGRGH